MAQSAGAIEGIVIQTELGPKLAHPLLNLPHPPFPPR